MCSIVCLTACAPLLTLVGSGGGAVQVAIQLDRIKLLSDGISYVQSGKMISDHVLSRIANADCKIGNAISGTPVCRRYSPIAAPETNEMILAAVTAWDGPAPASASETIETQLEDTPPASALAAVRDLSEHQ